MKKSCIIFSTCFAQATLFCNYYSYNIKINIISIYLSQLSKDSKNIEFGCIPNNNKEKDK